MRIWYGKYENYSSTESLISFLKINATTAKLVILHCSSEKNLKVNSSFLCNYAHTNTQAHTPTHTIHFWLCLQQCS